MLIREYFENCLAVARWDQVDALAHLGYLKRYAIRDGVTLDYTPYDDLIDEILRALIATGKALEVNTSGFRYGLPEWIRISIGTPAENARCIEVLKEVL